MSDKSIHLLLVEDNIEYASELRLLLDSTSSDKIVFTQAQTLQEAILCLGSERFDAVLLDINLPDSQGYNTFSEVIDQAPQLPVLVLSAEDDEALAMRLLRSGAQDCLVKGQLEHPRLLRLIRSAIERQRITEQMRQLSLIDELTGLLNRRGFFTLGKQHIKIAQRANRQLILFYTDLDGLKFINDRYGHHEGDQTLRHIAAILKDTFRSSDLVARMGGDEFTILAIDADRDSAENILNRLENRLEAVNAQNPRYQISLCTGFARFDPQRAQDLDKMLIEADAALYANKGVKGEP